MTGSVFVIDDEPDYTDTLRAILEHEGFKVIVANSGQEGLTKLIE